MSRRRRRHAFSQSAMQARFRHERIFYQLREKVSDVKRLLPRIGAKPRVEVFWDDLLP